MIKIRIGSFDYKGQSNNNLIIIIPAIFKLSYSQKEKKKYVVAD